MKQNKLITYILIAVILLIVIYTIDLSFNISIIIR